MIEKTEALALRVSPFSNTSHVVTWLTPQHGKLTTVVKGACRPKSPFLGQYDLFYTCELLFYVRDRNGLHIARECTPIAPRACLRSDWRGAAGASYLCDLLARVSVTGHSDPALYALSNKGLDALCEGHDKEAILYWIELQLLDALGMAPRLRHCAACGEGVAEETPPRFWQDRGGILCTRCAADRPKQTGMPLPPDVLAILRHWQQARSPRSARNTKCTDKQRVAFRDILGTFMDYHLDTMPTSRRMALEIVSFRTPQLEEKRR